MIDAGLMSSVLMGVFLGTVFAWIVRWFFGWFVIAAVYFGKQIAIAVSSRKPAISK